MKYLRNLYFESSNYNIQDQNHIFLKNNTFVKKSYISLLFLKNSQKKVSKCWIFPIFCRFLKYLLPLIFSEKSIFIQNYMEVLLNNSVSISKVILYFNWMLHIANSVTIFLKFIMVSPFFLKFCIGQAKHTGKVINRRRLATISDFV